MAVNSNLIIPTKGIKIDNAFFTDMCDTINHNSAKKAEFTLLATGGSSSSTWESDQSNWMPYSAYSQYDFLVFIVGESISNLKVLWVKTSTIDDDGTFYLNWEYYGTPSSSGVTVYYNTLYWDTGYVPGHTHGGDLIEDADACYKAGIGLKAGTPTYNRYAITYKKHIRYVYGVKI